MGFMENLPKTIIYIGLGLVAVGLLFWLGTKLGIRFGKLPGDISSQSENCSFYFPITTCILISVVLTLVVNLFFWLKK